MNDLAKGIEKVLDLKERAAKLESENARLRAAIAELEAALDRIRRVHPDMTKPASAAFFECVAIADRALQKPT
mgnify:CR=1 FL=1